MVSFSFTPFSSMSTVCLVISTVWLMRSVGDTNTVNTSAVRESSSQRRVTEASLTLSVQQLPVFVQVSEEEAVHQSGLTQARLTWNAVCSSFLCLYQNRQGSKHTTTPKQEVHLTAADCDSIDLLHAQHQP